MFHTNIQSAIHTNIHIQNIQALDVYHFFIMTYFEVFIAFMSQKKKEKSKQLEMSFDSSWPMSFKSVCWSDLKEKPNYCSGEAGGTWSTFAPGQLCLGRAPLRLQRSKVSWGVFRQMWRAACDQCHFNFSLVIMWWRTRQTDASLAGGTWMQESCFVAALLSSFFLKE